MQKFYGFEENKLEINDEMFANIKLDLMRKPFILLFICLSISKLILIFEQFSKRIQLLYVTIVVSI